MPPALWKGYVENFVDAVGREVVVDELHLLQLGSREVRVRNVDLLS